MYAKKVFIGPVEIAGYYANLTRGFREIGVLCDFITFSPHPFGYEGESSTPKLLLLARVLNTFRGKPGSPLVLKILAALLDQILRYVWSTYAIFKYDIFIFGFGCSLLPRNLDLIILRFLGKKVISNLSHGSDARPPYIDGGYQSKNGSLQLPIDQLIALSKYKYTSTAFIQRFSAVVLGSPFSTSHFSGRKLINSFAIGLPMVALKARPSEPICPSSITHSSLLSCSRVRILHSPSHPAAKGSPLIVQAISNLIQKGYEIDLVLLQNKPHSEIIRQIQNCDFVVDQLYSDTPMAGFAAEAASFGKPAVVGGYGFEYLKQFVPDNMWPPTKTCHPDDIEQAIEDLITNREERLRLGTDAYNFVCEKWSAAEVARRYLRLIDHDIPQELWFDPSTVMYLEGWGQPADCSKANIRHMVSNIGVESLQLDHRPDLARAFLDFAGVEDVS